MSAFRLAVEMGADGIETDIRRTKDGALVLFHDGDLSRLTGREEKISDLTYRALSGIPVFSPDGAVSDFVPTLAAFLRFVKAHPVFLALELKDDGLEADVLREIRAAGLGETCVVTSFRTEHLRRVKGLDPARPVGLLTREVNGDVTAALKQCGAEQICPKASLLSPQLVRRLHGEGFSVRAWGVHDEETMRYACRCGVDGMTVNFPDKLRAYLESEKETARNAPGGQPAQAAPDHR